MSPKWFSILLLWPLLFVQLSALFHGVLEHSYHCFFSPCLSLLTLLSFYLWSNLWFCEKHRSQNIQLKKKKKHSHLNLFLISIIGDWLFYKRLFSLYLLSISQFGECLPWGQAGKRNFNLLLTTNHSEYHDLSVLITREGPSMPRRPWTQNGTRLSSTRTFIWSRYCAEWQ